jgi:hypothetical protein
LVNISDAEGAPTRRSPWSVLLGRCGLAGNGVSASRRWLRWGLLVCIVVAVGYVAGRTPKEPVRHDACPIYYGARMLLHGQNPYDDAGIKAEVDREPVTACTDNFVGFPIRPFINPPITAIALLPIAILPPEIGLRALNYVNLLALLATAWLLATLGGEKWPFEARAALALFVLLNPAAMRTLMFGQISILICLSMVLALRAVERSKTRTAGVLLGLSLAKFTMTLPLVALLAFRRQRRVALIALAVCLVGCLVPLLPLGAGAVQAVHDLYAEMSATAKPGGINHYADWPASDHISIISLQRCSYLLFGRWPAVVEVASAMMGIALASAGLLALRRRLEKGEHAPSSLDLCLITLLTLTLLYHRYHDMTMNALALFGLLEYRISRLPRRSGWLWWSCVGLLLLMSFETTQAGWSRPVDWLLIRVGLQGLGQYTGVLLFILNVLVIALALRDRTAQAEVADPLPDSATALVPSSG